MTKDIDGLVETVHEAIRDAEGCMDKAEARAAIASVLEWYSKAENVNREMVAGYCRYLEQESSINMRAEAIASAMAAELKRRQV